MHRIAVLKAVVIDLQHLLDLLETKQLAARDPPRLKHLIRRRTAVNDAILLRTQIHLRALQYLEKAKLQLLRIQRIHRIKRMPEALKILIRKTRDQIQMLMDVVRSLHTVHVLRNLLKRCSPVDCRKRIPVDCLHTDLQLQKPRPQCPKQLQFLFIQKIRRDLTVKIRDSIVMIPQKTPQLQRPRMAAVEGAVHKFYLFYAFVQKILKFLLYKVKTAVPHPFIDGRQAVAARKWTATACLVINDAVLKLLQIPVNKRQLIQRFHRLRRRKKPDFLCGYSSDLRIAPRCHLTAP